jgi:hypothetical protein
MAAVLQAKEGTTQALERLKVDMTSFAVDVDRRVGPATYRSFYRTLQAQ